MRVTWRFAKPLRFYVLASTLLASVMLIVICGTLFIQSLPAVFSGTLFSASWNVAQESFGVGALLFGSVAVTLVALLLAGPLGFFSAIALSELCSRKVRIVLKSLVELLAGIPSIIYGLLGVALIVPLVPQVLDVATGRTILTAGCVLALMILPLFITLCDDALRNIPNRYREAATGLGLTRFEMVRTTLFPLAKQGIFGAFLLAVVRALGETMAVMLVIGGIDKIPHPFMNLAVPGQTLTSKIGRELAESVFGSLHFSALVALGLVLLVFVLGITYLSQHLIGYEARLHE